MFIIRHRTNSSLYTKLPVCSHPDHFIEFDLFTVFICKHTIEVRIWMVVNFCHMASTLKYDDTKTSAFVKSDLSQKDLN